MFGRQQIYGVIQLLHPMMECKCNLNVVPFNAWTILFTLRGISSLSYTSVYLAIDPGRITRTYIILVQQLRKIVALLLK